MANLTEDGDDKSKGVSSRLRGHALADGCSVTTEAHSESAGKSGFESDISELARSLAVSSATLWEDLLGRIRRLEHAQSELKELLTRVDLVTRAGVVTPLEAAPSSPAPPPPPPAGYVAISGRAPASSPLEGTQSHPGAQRNGDRDHSVAQIKPNFVTRSGRHRR